MPVIGFIGAGALDNYVLYLAAFRKGLAETGFVEGQNVAIEYRWAEGQYERMAQLADDLVRRMTDRFRYQPVIGRRFVERWHHQRVANRAGSRSEQTPGSG